jgi:hypothetical protein
MTGLSSTRSPPRRLATGRSALRWFGTSPSADGSKE